MNEYLTFDDVLILPNYSDLDSRKDASLEFKYKQLFLDLPIIGSPMDTVCGSDMCIALAENGALGILHRFMSIEDNLEEYSKFSACFGFEVGEANYLIGVSVGTNTAEMDRARALYKAGARIFCVDVAHGHSKACGNRVKELKGLDDDILVIAGSVATAQGTDYLIGCGADIIRVGIGGGCFVDSTKVQTERGFQSIVDIKSGDRVKTHDGSYQVVESVHKRRLKEGEELWDINGNVCTSNHEFLTIPRKKATEINSDNYLEYAEWVPAEFLDPDKHLLVELD